MRKGKITLGVIAILLVLALAFVALRNSYYLWLVGKFQDIPEKFWLHRVNSPLKMKEFAEKYSGFEMDALYNEKDRIFNNSHDAGDGQVPLSETLKFLKPSKGAWFDVKNLTEANSFNAEEDLSKIVKEAGIDKNKCIVESHCVPCLNFFASKGWKTAFYLIDEGKRQEDVKTQIYEAYKSNCKYLSMDGHMYELVKKNDLLKNKKYLVWYYWEPWYKVNNKKMYQDAVKNKDVEVILVKERGHFHR